MLNKLYLDNCFTHQDRTFEFGLGTTGIIGQNEAGKSLIVEMIRYALFGSKALRGKAEDYKKLHVELDFTVAGEDYHVLRKGSKTELTGARQASGTKPVNEAIVSVLGYDLTVFDVANVCNQGNVEALSDMTPSERRRMVDRTIGLDQLDQLIAFCGTEGNTLKREAAAVEASLVEPEEPEKPEEYIATSEFHDLLGKAKDEANEWRSLKSAIDNAPAKPEAPVRCKVLVDAHTLRAAKSEQDDIKQDILIRKRELNGLEPEVHSEADLADFEQWLTDFERWTEKERLLAQGHHECPKCAHQWPVADLGDLEKAVETRKPPLTRSDIRKHRERVGNSARIKELQAETAGLEKQLDAEVEKQLRVREAYEADLEAYDQALRAYYKAHKELPEKQARFAELEGAVESLEDLQERFLVMRDYERDLSRFEEHKAQWESALDQVATLRARGDEYLSARDIIQQLKVKVKTHLMPSLNKVASFLLAQMTGGERHTVEVSEEFEITIDGQPVNTLSGSGKAVANLSIRIALGQILTNRVFSVFMADEVDAAMDEERASYTAEALTRLTETISQVVLVTHKRPQTSNTIELRK